MNPFDLAISSFLNGFAHRSLRFDEFIVVISTSNLFKGGVLMTLLYWLWFRRADRRVRETLIATVIAIFPALSFGRILSWVVHRPRPLLETGFPFRVPYDMAPSIWQKMNSFPSDHAILFFSLATGIFLVSRRLGWFAFIYVTIVICLPRIFLGEHYATDIIAGAAIGAASVWICTRMPMRRLLTDWVLKWQEARPELFYAAVFLLSYQIVELFDPALNLLKAAKYIIQGRLGAA